MSVFSNPMNSAKDAAEAYVKAILDLLGDREPISVLEKTVAEIGSAIKELNLEDLTRPEATGKWSILEVIQHLADSELVWAYRLRMVLAEDRPVLTGYDQARWAKRLHYRDVNVEDALIQFHVLRDANLRLLHSLSQSDLKRVGVHNERGEESVEHMIRLYAGHDLVHLRQIDRIKQEN